MIVQIVNVFIKYHVEKFEKKHLQPTQLVVQLEIVCPEVVSQVTRGGCARLRIPENGETAVQCFRGFSLI